jgi:hypothetical protein
VDHVSGTDNPLVGTWTYRSFRNVAEHVEPLDRLLFAEATLRIDEAPFGTFAGSLDMGEAGTLTMKGSAGYGTPFAVRFQGVGHAGVSDGWVYDYIGYLVPAWPNGVNQVPAIVGSVIRTVDHSNGQAKAGVVASFVAVKQV